MKRREFLELSAAGLATNLILPASTLAQTVCEMCDVGPGGAADKIYELEVGDMTTRLVDGLMVTQLAYRLSNPAQAWRVPGPVLRVKEGKRVQIKITNTRQETHGFEITGIPETKTEIAPGCSCTVTFVAPQGGTYIYHDAYGDTPLYRILGLHGVMVVEPLNGITKKTAKNPYPSPTPYSLDTLAAGPRNAITKLFDALGTTERFLGGADGKWKPAGSDFDYENQEKVWVLSEIDPRFNALVERGIPIKSNPSLTSDIVGNFVPRYFTMLNRSGFDLSGGADVCPANYIGEPTLLRMVNVGLAHHGPHIHGNHVMRLSQANLDPNSADFGKVEVADNIFEVDTWSVWPLDRRDVLLPFEIPPDIPYKALVAAEQGPAQFQKMAARQTQEILPLRYVMHDHVEMSQTAAGGNYPQGMVTHWEVLGGVGGRAVAQAALSQ